MAKLRVDKIAAPIIKDEYTGSVYFDGSGDYLSPCLIMETSLWDLEILLLSYGQILMLLESNKWMVARRNSSSWK